MALHLPLVQGRGANSDLYNHALSAAYRSGAFRLYDPDYALAQEPDIFEVVRRDPSIAADFQQRFLSVVREEWACIPGGDSPADKQLAKVMEELLQNIEMFMMARCELAKSSVTARAYAYVTGERRMESFGGMRALRWWVPTKLSDVDRRRIRFAVRWKKDRSDYETYPEFWSVMRDQWEELLHPEFFVKIAYDDYEARLNYGRGLLEAVYFYHYAKTIVIREGLQGLERWAQGMPVVRIDNLRSAATTNDGTTQANRWVSTIEAMRARHCLVFDKSDEIDVFEPSGEGARQVQWWLEYLDRCITRLVNGSVRPTGGGGMAQSGARAQAEVEQDSSDRIYTFDRSLIDEALTRDLIGLVIKLNRPILAIMGLAGAKPPKFKTMLEEREDPREAIDVIKGMQGAGMSVRADEAYKKVGFTKPLPGEEILKAPPQQQPFDPFGFGRGLPGRSSPDGDQDADGTGQPARLPKPTNGVNPEAALAGAAEERKVA